MMVLEKWRCMMHLKRFGGDWALCTKIRDGLMCCFNDDGTRLGSLPFVILPYISSLLSLSGSAYRTCDVSTLESAGRSRADGGDLPH
jgi:hypothetical protein